MLQDANRVGIRSIDVCAIEIPLDVSFVEFSKIGGVDSHFNNLLQVILEEWEGHEWLIKESLFGDWIVSRYLSMILIIETISIKAINLLRLVLADFITYL